MTIEWTEQVEIARATKSQDGSWEKGILGPVASATTTMHDAWLLLLPPPPPGHGTQAIGPHPGTLASNISLSPSGWRTAGMITSK